MLPRFTLGDTLAFTTALSSYPAPAWVLKFRLVPRGAGTAIDVTCTASGTGHLAAATATATAAWGPGTYSWASWVEQGATSISIDSGVTVLLPNPRTAASSLDVRTDDEIALDNIRATLRGTANDNTLSYEIAGRKLQHYAIADLLLLEAKFATAVQNALAKANRAAGLADPRKVYVRLARA